MELDLLTFLRNDMGRSISLQIFGTVCKELKFCFMSGLSDLDFGISPVRYHRRSARFILMYRRANYSSSEHYFGR